MITRIDVDGFKSLSGFQLYLKPGLNILVGPNGSGKTNIVSLFEFLTHLIESDASEATSRTGGAGAVFRRIENAYEKEISVKIFGCAPFQDIRGRKSKKKSTEEFVCYEYAFKLLFPDSRDSVLFESQRVRVRLAEHYIDAELSDKNSLASGWGIDINAMLDSTGIIKATVHRFDDNFADYPIFDEKASAKDRAEQLSKIITEMLTQNLSLVNIMRRFSYGFSLIADDVTSGHVYNIVPTRIKLAEDSAKAPMIGRDGSGLSATLYALQRSKDVENINSRAWFAPPPRKRTFGPSSLEQLKGYLRVVNSAIEDINVYNDSFDNQLRVAFIIRSGNYKASVPLALMSDGTLKWVALITAALTARSVFSIEEPENYLHPQMQTRMVDILREILFRDSQYKMTIMTTHSETLLNHCRPEELIITGMTDGCTTAVRCGSPDDVAAEIRRTGFGLGYYYVAGALQND